MAQKPKKLVFENGEVFCGKGFGADTTAICEVVCNRSMVGYQEILSDPAYCGQLVCMTYPLLGNYGITNEDFEGRLFPIGGLIVREYNDSMANFRAIETLAEAMEEHGIPGIEGVDTRCIAKMIAEEGNIKAILCDASLPQQEALELLRQPTTAENPLEVVSCQKRWHARAANARFNVVVIDCGIKKSIVHNLVQRNCNVTVVPYNCQAEEIKGLCPDGILVAGGPGVPADGAQTIEIIRQLVGTAPLFGIGLGHLLVASALGCALEKMETPHLGGSYPVRCMETGTIITAAQNHCYVVARQGLEKTDFTVSYENVLDKTVEGLQNTAQKIFTVQFNPEGAPGPKDALPLFDEFVKIMDSTAKGGRVYA